ncbi:MAG TPA: hypothetical protein VMU89_15145 [Thermomicrobiaceae bacterium]|nr:hypothetical protein [Thermomicrobiaceae bacterium]
MALVEPGGYQRFLAGTPATLSVTFFDGSTVVDPGTVTVGVTTANGTALYAAGTATAGTGAAARTLALTTTDTAQLDQLTAVWVSPTEGTVTTYAEIVGQRIFSLSDARAVDRGQLASASDYPDDVLEEVRQRIEDDFEEICGVSFIPRFAFEYYDGRGTQTLMLRKFKEVTVRSIEVRTIGTTTWEAYDTTEMSLTFTDRHGVLLHELGVPFWPAFQNVRIGVEHGYRQVPLPIRRAALILAASGAVGAVASNLPDRATSMQTPEGSYVLSTPGLRGSYYGIPRVDSVLARFNERTRSFG